MDWGISLWVRVNSFRFAGEKGGFRFSPSSPSAAATLCVRSTCHRHLSLPPADSRLSSSATGGGHRKSPFRPRFQLRRACFRARKACHRHACPNLADFFLPLSATGGGRKKSLSLTPFKTAAARALGKWLLKFHLFGDFFGDRAILCGLGYSFGDRGFLTRLG